MSTQKTFLFVIGMHRSGTSALTGCLNKLGLTIGKKIIPPSFDNKKGFFENRLICNLNDTILNYFGISWASVKALPENWIEDDKIPDFLETAYSIIKNEFEEYEDIILIKDPRISLLLPFWCKVVDIFEGIPKVIISLRNPEKIVSSLKTRNHIPKNKAYILWYNYISNAERYSRDIERFFIDFNELRTKPIEVLSKCCKHFALDLEKNIAIQEKAISNFIDKKNNGASDNSKSKYSLPQQFIKFHNTLLKFRQNLHSKTTKAQIEKINLEIKQQIDFYYKGIVNDVVYFSECYFSYESRVTYTQKNLAHKGSVEVNIDLKNMPL